MSRQIAAVASMPSTFGMRTSISTTSGRSSRAARIASAPSAASPAISPGRASRPGCGRRRDGSSARSTPRVRRSCASASRAVSEMASNISAARAGSLRTATGPASACTATMLIEWARMSCISRAIRSRSRAAAASCSSARRRARSSSIAMRSRRARAEVPIAYATTNGAAATSSFAPLPPRPRVCAEPSRTAAARTAAVTAPSTSRRSGGHSAANV